TNRQIDFTRLHAINHVGKAYRVRGPLNAPRPPQGWPVLVQAGSSDDGREFAARFGELIFTVQQSLETAQLFYADVKARAAGCGRNPDHVKILPGLCPFIGSTEGEASRLHAELDDLAIPAEGPINWRSINFVGVDLSNLPPDEPLPIELLPTAEEFEG